MKTLQAEVVYPPEVDENSVTIKRSVTMKTEKKEELSTLNSIAMAIGSTVVLESTLGCVDRVDAWADLASQPGVVVVECDG